MSSVQATSRQRIAVNKARCRMQVTLRASPWIRLKDGWTVVPAMQSGFDLSPYRVRRLGNLVPKRKWERPYRGLVTIWARGDKGGLEPLVPARKSERAVSRSRHHLGA